MVCRLSIFCTLLVLFGTFTAAAQISEETVVYEIDGQPFEGRSTRNLDSGDRQPVVLIVHDWTGPDAIYDRRRASRLADRGYAVFVLDLYGQGTRPQEFKEGRPIFEGLLGDQATLRRRLDAGLEQARGQAGADPERVVAIASSFGAAAVLELARSGADLDGFVVFHGRLVTPEGQDYSAVRAPILVLHATNDQIVPVPQVLALTDALNDAGVPHDVQLFGRAKHGFTYLTVSGDAVAYDLRADVKSWDAMVDFLEERLR